MVACLRLVYMLMFGLHKRYCLSITLCDCRLYGYAYVSTIVVCHIPLVDWRVFVLLLYSFDDSIGGPWVLIGLIIARHVIGGSLKEHCEGLGGIWGVLGGSHGRPLGAKSPKHAIGGKKN